MFFFLFFVVFFFNDTATTEIYTLSLHDALPISKVGAPLPKNIPRFEVVDIVSPTPAVPPAGTAVSFATPTAPPKDGFSAFDKAIGIGLIDN